MPIKTTVKYHIEMAIIKKEKINLSENVEILDSLCIAGENTVSLLRSKRGGSPPT